MIVRPLESIRDTERHVASTTNENWASVRYLLQRDGFPFTVTRTELDPGCRMEISYQNHVEACLCISGTGRVYEGPEAIPHELYPGVLYAITKGERHVLEARDALVLISIFSPALVGPEIHDETGSYLAAPDAT
jgi:L-ectoine synthase